jgi:hypothetical protein
VVSSDNSRLILIKPGFTVILKRWFLQTVVG